MVPVFQILCSFLSFSQYNHYLSIIWQEEFKKLVKPTADAMGEAQVLKINSKFYFCGLNFGAIFTLSFRDLTEQTKHAECTLKCKGTFD